MGGLYRARRDYVVDIDDLIHFVLRGGDPVFTVCLNYDVDMFPDDDESYRRAYRRTTVTCLECVALRDTRCPCGDACCTVCNPTGKRY